MALAITCAEDDTGDVLPEKFKTKKQDDESFKKKFEKVLESWCDDSGAGWRFNNIEL